MTADVKTLTNGGPSSQPTFPIGRRGHTAVLYGNSMFIYGGYVDMKGSSGELWQFKFGMLALFQANLPLLPSGGVKSESPEVRLLARSQSLVGDSDSGYVLLDCTFCCSLFDFSSVLFMIKILLVHYCALCIGRS